MQDFLIDQKVLLEKDALSDPLADQTLTGAFPQLVQKQLEAMEKDELNVDNLSHENKKLLGVANYLEKLAENEPEVGNQGTLQSAQHFAETAKIELATHLVVEDMQEFIDHSLEHTTFERNDFESVVADNQTKVWEYLADKDVNPTQASATGARIRQQKNTPGYQPAPNDLPVFSIGDNPELTITKSDLGKELKEFNTKRGVLEPEEILHFDPNNNPHPTVQEQIKEMYGENSPQYQTSKDAIRMQVHQREPVGGDSVYAQQLNQFSNALDLVKNDNQLMHEIETSPAMQEPRMKELMGDLTAKEGIENIQATSQHIIEQERLIQAVNLSLEREGLEPLDPNIQSIQPQNDRESFHEGPRPEDLEIHPYKRMEDKDRSKGNPSPNYQEVEDATWNQYNQTNQDRHYQGVASPNQPVRAQSPEPKDRPPTVRIGDVLSANQLEEAQRITGQAQQQERENIMPELTLKDMDRKILDQAKDMSKSLAHQLSDPNKGPEGPGL